RGRRGDDMEVRVRVDLVRARSVVAGHAERARGARRPALRRLVEVADVVRRGATAAGAAGAAAGCVEALAGAGAADLRARASGAGLTALTALRVRLARHRHADRAVAAAVAVAARAPAHVLRHDEPVGELFTAAALAGTVAGAGCAARLRTFTAAEAVAAL